MPVTKCRRFPRRRHPRSAVGYTTAVGGTFVLQFKETATSSTKTTAAIAFNDTAASVKSKLEAIVQDNGQHLSVNVIGSGTFADPWQITFNNPALQDIRR